MIFTDLFLLLMIISVIAGAYIFIKEVTREND
jgi:hypothetical protein